MSSISPSASTEPEPEPIPSPSTPPRPAVATVERYQPVVASVQEADLARNNDALRADLEHAGRMLGPYDRDLASYPVAYRTPDGTTVDHPGFKSLVARDRTTGQDGLPLSVVSDSYGMVTNRMAAVPLATLASQGHILDELKVVESPDQRFITMHGHTGTVQTDLGPARTSISISTAHDSSHAVRGGVHLEIMKQDGERDYILNAPLTGWNRRHSSGARNHLVAAQDLLNDASQTRQALLERAGSLRAIPLNEAQVEHVILKTFNDNPLDMSPQAMERMRSLSEQAVQASGGTPDQPVNGLQLFATIARHVDHARVRSTTDASTLERSVTFGTRAMHKARAMDLILAAGKQDPVAPEL